MLLEQCATDEMLIKAEELLENRGLTAKQKDELFTAEAWAFFRQKHYVRAKEKGKMAKNNDFAKECLDAIAAILGEQEKVKGYEVCLPESILADNAWIIFARQRDSKMAAEEVLRIAGRWLGDGVIADPIYRANVANNTARYFLEKTSGRENMKLAKKYIQLAISLYGRGDINLHHRASAHFWLSKIAKKLGSREDAIIFAEASLDLWEEQLKFDPENKSFKDSRNGAKAYLETLKNQ